MTWICFAHLVLSTIFGTLVVSRRVVLARLRIASLVSPIIMNCRSRLNQSCRVARNVACVLACSVAPVVLASFVRFVVALVWNAAFIFASRIVCRHIHMERPCLELGLILALSWRWPYHRTLSCTHTSPVVQCMDLYTPISRCICSTPSNTVPLWNNVACSHALCW